MIIKEIIDRYIGFFEARGHTRLPNAPLVPQNDPTTLFTNSGMQPLIPFLSGEPHPGGKRFVNVQNCFRGQGVLDDINEVGDNSHLTFFRMLGNWSLGDYFKNEQIHWMFTFITQELSIEPRRLYVSVFAGDKQIPKDTKANAIWTEIFSHLGLEPKEHIFAYGVEKNWWSRAGVPEQMPAGELGGPDSEIFYDFEAGKPDRIHTNSFYKDQPCHINCDCGRYLEISNNVFMQYRKSVDGKFEKLPQKNIDQGAGAERLLQAVEDQQDVYRTSLFYPIIRIIEEQTKKEYTAYVREMRMITAHLASSCFIVHAGIQPANKEQGYILRRLIRRAVDSYHKLGGKDITPILEIIVSQYSVTDPDVSAKFETIKYTLLEEAVRYNKSLNKARAFLIKKYQQTEDNLRGTVNISADDAFHIYTSHGLSPTQIKSLGYTFDAEDFAEKMKQHKSLSRSGAQQKFRGGLADQQERTIMGHTATHLLQQALRDVLGDHVRQTGSNITAQRLRFDFIHGQKLADIQIKKVEAIINEKIKQNLPVHFEMLPLETAKSIGAIGLFDEKYEDKVKVYFIGGSGRIGDHTAYSKEFCGGPHVDFTGVLKSFKLIRQENIGNKKRRLYGVVGI